MSGKIQFREKLNGILSMAEKQSHKMTINEVEQYFEDDHLTKEQLELVCDYLVSQKVTVGGYQKKGGATKEHGMEKQQVLSQEEEAYLREYMSELQGCKQEEDGERKLLLEKAMEQDSLAKGRLIEIYLPKVIELAKSMRHQEIFIGDMIQEGNVSLILALDELTNLEEADAYICKKIQQGIQALIEEQTELKKLDRQMVEKVNFLDESIRNLTEDLGRKVTIEELSAYLEMQEEEVLDILKLAGEEVEEEEEHDD